MKYRLTLALSAGLRVAGACDCLPPASLQAAYNSADYVGRVRVVALRDTVHYDLYSNPIRPPFRSGYLPVLRVEKTFKGRMFRKSVLLVGGGQGMCEVYFQLGATYVVFLYKYQGGYATSLCQKNFMLSDTAALRAFQLVRR